MSRLLDRIDSPSDLKPLSIAELETLAFELREEIVRVVSRTGGHLAPSLGVVELTLALLRVFDLPRDRIVWDVGHQSYVHKILTGRREQFETLRQYGGIAGFPRREESPYDAFNTGHSSTSISAALGMACGSGLTGDGGRAIAVIGDGSLTAGLAFEGLNQAGHLKKDLIVVVNDNRMSISKNVGALSQYLTRLRTAPTYHRLESEVWEIMGRIPAVGARARELTSRVLEGIRGVFTPGMLFEEMGFKYFGPIDGHNVELLVDAFERLAYIEGPLLVHVITQKGRGYGPAEEDASRFHGLGSFDKATGTSKSKPKAISYTEAFGRSLATLADDDERIAAITAAMPGGTGLLTFAKNHPDRFFDVGIAEQHAVTFAAGLAASGMKPVVAIYSTFLQRAYDQIIHDVCLQSLPVRFMIDRGGIVGDDGPTHHGVFDLTFLRAVPNLVVMAPKDENELTRMVRTAIDRQDGPTAVRYPRGAGLGVRMDFDPDPIPIGEGERLRSGSDVSLIAVGSMVQVAVAAADILARDGVEASVINARFVKPLDRKLIVEEAESTGRIVTMEENVVGGGFGAGVMELLQSVGLDDVGIRILGLPDHFVTHGPRDRLLADCRLTAEDVAERARGLVAASGERASLQRRLPRVE